MNKKIEEAIETELDEVSTDVCLYKEDVPDGDITDLSTKGKEHVAMALNISVELADTLIMLAGELTDKLNAINRDLKFLGAKILD